MSIPALNIATSPDITFLSASPCSQPLANAAPKPAFKLGFLLIGIFGALKAIPMFSWLRRSGAFDSAAVRLTVVRNRGNISVNQSAIASLGLLRDGCRLIPLAAPALQQPAQSFSVAFSRPVRANGYYFETAGGPPEADPVAWSVESFDGAAWRPIGASTEIVWPRSGHTVPRDLHPRVPYPTPTGRHAVVAVDHRPSLPRVLEFLTGLNGIAGILACLAASLLSRVQWVRPLVIAIFVPPVLVYAFSAVWHQCVEQRHAAFVYWTTAVNPAIMVVGLVFREEYTVAYSMLCLVMHSAMRCYCRWALFGELWDLAPLLRWIFIDSPYLPVFFLGFMIPCLRRWVLAQSRGLILADQQRYDAAWADTLSDPAAREALRDLRELVAELRQRAAGAPPRQRRVLPRPAALEPVDCGPPPVPSSVLRWVPSFYGDDDLGRDRVPADCLDQLFTQAACLNPILTGKVMAWALASGGCLPCAAGGGGKGSRSLVFVRAAELGDGRLVQWAKIKSRSRAIEKTVRSYHGVSSFTYHLALLQYGPLRKLLMYLTCT